MTSDSDSECGIWRYIQFSLFTLCKLVDKMLLENPNTVQNIFEIKIYYSIHFSLFSLIFISIYEAAWLKLCTEGKCFIVHVYPLEVSFQ